MKIVLQAAGGGHSARTQNRRSANEAGYAQWRETVRQHVPCVECGAVIGDPCVKRSGAPTVNGKIHEPRKQAWDVWKAAQNLRMAYDDLARVGGAGKDQRRRIPSSSTPGGRDPNRDAIARARDAQRQQNSKDVNGL